MQHAPLWQGFYARFNRENLATLDVVPREDTDDFLVEEHHPVVVFIVANDAMEECGLDLHPLATLPDGRRYYTVDKTVLVACCEHLLSDVFDPIYSDDQRFHINCMVDIIDTTDEGYYTVDHVSSKPRNDDPEEIARCIWW